MNIIMFTSVCATDVCLILFLCKNKSWLIEQIEQHSIELTTMTYNNKNRLNGNGAFLGIPSADSLEC